MNDHERLILGALLRYHAQIPRIVEMVRPEMFEDVRHQQIYLLLVRQATTSYPYTVETFTNFLDQSHGDPGKKQELIQYLIALTGEYATIEKSEFEHAIESLRRAHKRRALISGVSKALDQLRNDKLDDVEATIAQVLDTVASAEEGSQFAKFSVVDVVSNYRMASEGKIAPGIPFGFPRIDAITGGHQRGQLVIWGAYTSQGKTRLAMKVAHRAATLGYNVLFVSLEMKNNYIMIVLTCGHAYEFAGRKIDINRAKAGKLTAEDYQTFEAAARDLTERGKIHLWSPGRVKVSDIKRRVASLKLTDSLDLVVVDYTKLVLPEQRRNTRKEELDEVLCDLKGLGMSEDVSVLALHQMSRHGLQAADERGYYILEDFGDTSEVERNADIAGWSYMPPQFERQCESKIGLAKVREGAKLLEGYMICSDMANGILCERNEMPDQSIMDRYIG